MFSEKSAKFLRDEMCVCLDDLKAHIMSTVPHYSGVFSNLFNLLPDIKLVHEQFELGDRAYYENDEHLNSTIMNFASDHGINEGTDEFFILDSLRHAFVSYRFGGVSELYKNREAEYWYPKIIIREKLKPNDLAGEIIIYRGTSMVEFESGRFSQSWTLSKEVATDFAFNHYQNHEGYLGTERVVLKAEIDSDDVYYFDEEDDEKEVVIDERKLGTHNVAIIERSVIEDFR